MSTPIAISQLLDHLADAVMRGTLVKLTLGKPSATAGDLKSIDIRPVMIKRELKLSFTHHHRTNDVVKNYPPQEAMALVEMQLREHFGQGKLFTTTADWQLAGESLKHLPPSQTEVPELSHDRTKQRLIVSEGKPYLHALGITDAKGTVYKNAQDKFRQINKYIEILDGLVRALPNQKLRVVDMGAGKGYLTFALYDYLTHTLKREVEITGVEFRADLVTKCNDIAQAAGFKGLQFTQGSIVNYDCAGADVVIALHACDTATDDAIAKAVKANAALVVVAPCCHKAIRRGMANSAPGLEFLMRYGTYAERIAEMVTDGMRAQLLEWAGYQVNLFEFISDAHTPKNVMIVASKLASPRKEAERARLRAAMDTEKAQFGIDAHPLEKMLG